MNDIIKEADTYTVYNPDTRKIDTFNIYTGELITIGRELSSFLYTIEMGAILCNLVREGKTLLQISKMEGMPALHLMYTWKGHNPEFAMKMKQAKKDRAEYHMDRAAELLEGASELEKDDVSANKLAIDGFIKLAEKGNPEEFQPKPQLLQTQIAPAMIVINTGISREPITVEVPREDSKQDQAIPVRERSKEIKSTCQIIEELDCEVGCEEESKGS